MNEIVWGIALTEKQIHKIEPNTVAKDYLLNNYVSLMNILRNVVSEHELSVFSPGHKGQDYYVIGLSWGDFKGDETKSQFLNRVKSSIESALGKSVEISVYFLEK